MCSGSEAGSYLRLIDFVPLNSRLESNQEEEGLEFWVQEFVAFGLGPSDDFLVLELGF